MRGMYRIIINHGLQFPAGFCAAVNGLLTMSIKTDLDFLSVAQAFSAVQTISFAYDNTEDAFDGYTALVMVNKSADDEYLITLKKEVDQ